MEIVIIDKVSGESRLVDRTKCEVIPECITDELVNVDMKLMYEDDFLEYRLIDEHEYADSVRRAIKQNL
jgi:hypothetical protein